MRICIDPGHGMSAARVGLYDPGAVATLPDGSTHQEADIALDWSLRLGQALQERGQSLFWTRTSRADPAPTGARSGRAVGAGCRAFVSVHCNAFTNPQANGTETLFRTPEAGSVARAVNSALVAVLGTTDRGAKHRDNLAVLRFPGPSILIEIGFITNAADRAKMLDPALMEAGCEAIATALLRALP